MYKKIFNIYDICRLFSAILFFAVQLLFFAVVTVFASDADLVGRWSFDEVSENVILNSVNEKFSAISHQPVSLVDGVHGKGINLNGSKIEIPADFLPSGLEQLTFSAWIAPRRLNGFQQIFRKEDASGPVQNRLLFSFQNSGKFLTLGLNTGGNYAECDALITPEEILDGKWHLVAGTFDGKFMRVYLDGKEIGNVERQSSKINTSADFRPLKHYWRYEYGNWKNVDDVTVNAPAYIGSFNGNNEFFDGNLDDFRFYRKALSKQEIIELYGTGKQIQSDAIKNAEIKAAKLYVKSDSYLKTLIATKTKIAQTKLEPLTLVALHRILRNDYPAEVNNSIVKYERSPIELATWNTDDLIKRATELETAYLEYLPLTETQWRLLSDKERKKWNRVKSIHEALKNEKSKTPNYNANVLFEIVYEMEKEIEQRPKAHEAVAGYITPSTPEVKNKTKEEAQNIIEAEWLFQCDNKPTIERIKQEIIWTRKLAERIEKQYPNNINFDAEKKQLDELEATAKLKQNSDNDAELYFSVRKIKRIITFKNPVINFNSLIFVDSPLPRGSEPHHETRHRLGYMAIPGGRLMKLDGLSPDGLQTKLAPKEPLHGSFWRPDLSYDAKRVLVSFKPHNEKNFHIYEINIDGSGERQLTGGIFDDLDPIYLPDGKNIMFLTTRGHIYVRCMPPTNAFVLARMPVDTKPGDKNLYIISRNGEPEYTPSVTHDGRIIYTRWEYTDKPLWRAQSLWTMNTDGTLVQTFWGNQSVWPDLLKDARQIPGSERIMFTGSAHHNWFNGSIGIIDPSKGFNFPDGLTKVTQEVIWPECGNGPVDPKETDEYHVAGKYNHYYSPYPLSETDFLVSAQRNFRGNKFVLLLMDVNGNREIIFEGEHNIFDAQPVRTRPMPPVSADRVNWPTWENRDKPEAGIIYSNNVYENAPEKLRDKAKYLRIWSIDHKTYTYWGKRNYVSSGPEISASQSEGIKKIIGTVPIEADGSVSFEAPSGIALHFQLLDENQLALQTMKSFTGVLPGEIRGCLGCHESHIRTPVTKQTGKALKKAPSKIKPVDWEDISVSFERYVQPALDKHCGKCHQDPSNEAYKKFNATLRAGFLGFKEPYMTLMGNPTWARKYNLPDGAGGLGWADTIIVEGYTTLDPKAYATFPPMERLSYVSRLVKRMSNGEHHNVKVTGEDLLRVILWVDAMGPYYGTEEVRCMEDPIFQGKDWISQTPRIKTAPIVQRPGPFDPFQTDSAYDNPDPKNYNALPYGVFRIKN
ncbi:MAG: hypothetical protein LBP59_07985 [Planctomycetaceae bacterium]|jgi:hypothetical protein|nr:hypothetical protein [Planctomycetaceae bacterium]